MTRKINCQVSLFMCFLCLFPQGGLPGLTHLAKAKFQKDKLQHTTVMLADILLTKASHVSKLRVNVGEEMGGSLYPYRSMDAGRSGSLGVKEGDNLPQSSSAGEPIITPSFPSSPAYVSSHHGIPRPVPSSQAHSLLGLRSCCDLLLHVPAFSMSQPSLSS